MTRREKQRKLLEVLRSLERDGTRLSVDDFVEHVERATGYQDSRHYLTRYLSGALVHRRESDDTVTVKGAVALDEADFANPAWELPESVWQRQVEVGCVAPALDSNKRARIVQRLAEDAARCEAAGVHFNPPFVHPQFRSPSQQVGWQRPYIRTNTLETWDPPRPEPGVDRSTPASSWKARITRVDVFAKGRQEACARWIEAWPSSISYDVCRADPEYWFAIKHLATFATLDEALVCVAAYRARAD